MAKPVLSVAPLPIFKKEERICTSENEQLVYDVLSGLFSNTPLKNFPLKKLYRTVVKNKDPEFHNLAFKEMQSILQELYEHRKNIPELAFTCAIAQLLALLAFIEIPEGTKIFVPVFENEWKLVSFQCMRVELTPRFLSSPVIAYGLESDESLHRLLLFRGTGYPTLSGTFLSFLTGFTPGFSVGTSLWKTCIQKRVQNWLVKSTKKVLVFGKSLGGSFALFLERDFPQYVAKVYACNPAASFFSHTSKEGSVTIYVSEQDPVFYVGAYSPSWTVYALSTTGKTSAFMAHVRAYPFLETTIFKKANLKNQRGRRFTTTALHQLISIVLFPVLSLVLACKAVKSVVQRFFRT